ncbi:MAG: dihydroxyacetone kinase subunit DhaL [Vallitalea sp.]|jgi:dihydroxyacetone kinase-like protein|nr:dihydroxyacetone kinase subunit DhaL [Vallitalea sp.]
MTTKIYQCMVEINKKIQENKEFLTELDGAIGDADHGINMARGFSEVVKQLPDDEEDIGVILKKTAMILLSKVGGASGPLYGTAFLKAAGVVQGATTLNGQQISDMLEAALNGIKLRGKATVGEKTMVDAIEPAYIAFKKSQDEGKTIGEGLDIICEEARKAVEYTKTIRATKGRASYLGDRSIGHQDPGATSVLIICETINSFYKSIN